jgi:hypothetical protein
MESAHVAQRREPWNKGKLVGQKAPFKPQGDLGYSGPLADAATTAGARALRPRYR